VVGAAKVLVTSLFSVMHSFSLLGPFGGPNLMLALQFTPVVISMN
jgi:hypothetical protein